MDVNPLATEFCFPSLFERQPKIRSYRLPTHSRGALEKFLSVTPSYFRTLILGKRDCNVILDTEWITISSCDRDSASINIQIVSLYIVLSVLTVCNNNHCVTEKKKKKHLTTFILCL